MCILYIYIYYMYYIYIMYIYCYIHTILFGDTLLFWCYRAPVPSLAPQSLTWPSICEPQTLKQSKPLTLSLKLVNTNPETLCNLLKPYKQNCRCYKKKRAQTYLRLSPYLRSRNAPRDPRWARPVGTPKESHRRHCLVYFRVSGFGV